MSKACSEGWARLSEENKALQVSREKFWSWKVKTFSKIVVSETGLKHRSHLSTAPNPSQFSWMYHKKEWPLNFHLWITIKYRWTAKYIIIPKIFKRLKTSILIFASTDSTFTKMLLGISLTPRVQYYWVLYSN